MRVVGVCFVLRNSKKIGQTFAHGQVWARNLTFFVI
jgi:hypothetical protein